VWLPEYLEKFSADALRYTLARNLPETRDMNFTWEGFQARNDNELGNNFGNLINRVLTFIHKYFDGVVPEWSEATMEDMDRQVLADVAELREKWAAHLENFEIKAAMECAFAAGQAGNRYFDESAPFKTRKTDMARCGHSLAIAVQVLRQLCVMLAPVLPFGMTRLWSWLGMETALFHGSWDEALRDVPAGRPLGDTEILYPRLEPEKVQAEIDRLARLVETIDEE
jgi:methionyl-tRNA synthetase